MKEQQIINVLKKSTSSISPSEEWESKTLLKLRVLEESMEVGTKQTPSVFLTLFSNKYFIGAASLLLIFIISTPFLLPSIWQTQNDNQSFEASEVTAEELEQIRIALGSTPSRRLSQTNQLNEEIAADSFSRQDESLLGTLETDLSTLPLDPYFGLSLVNTYTKQVESIEKGPQFNTCKGVFFHQYPEHIGLIETTNLYGERGTAYTKFRVLDENGTLMQEDLSIRTLTSNNTYHYRGGNYGILESFTFIVEDEDLAAISRPSNPPLETPRSNNSSPIQDIELDAQKIRNASGDTLFVTTNSYEYDCLSRDDEVSGGEQPDFWNGENRSLSDDTFETKNIVHITTLDSETYAIVSNELYINTESENNLIFASTIQNERQENISISEFSNEFEPDNSINYRTANYDNTDYIYPDDVINYIFDSNPVLYVPTTEQITYLDSTAFYEQQSNSNLWNSREYYRSDSVGEYMWNQDTRYLRSEAVDTIKYTIGVQDEERGIWIDLAVRENNALSNIEIVNRNIWMPVMEKSILEGTIAVDNTDVPATIYQYDYDNCPEDSPAQPEEEGSVEELLLERDYMCESGGAVLIADLESGVFSANLFGKDSANIIEIMNSLNLRSISGDNTTEKQAIIDQLKVIETNIGIIEPLPLEVLPENSEQ